MFPKLTANLKESRYESIEELHSTKTAKADLLKTVCRMLGKTDSCWNPCINAGEHYFKGNDI
jgi:hypothetical protein